MRSCRRFFDKASLSSAICILLFFLVSLCASAAPPKKLTRTEAQQILDRHGVHEIVFAVRSIHQEHWYANFGYLSFSPEMKLYDKAGRLCKLDLRTGAVMDLLNDPEGSMRDPAVDYDGRRILFSYRKAGSDYYHLYQIDASGAGLKQLTDGDCDDIEPCPLPDGGIVFVSSRCRRWVNCWLSQVATIHRCDGDGRNIRQLSANIEQDNTPWVLPDGRILYMRWEYVDRSQVNYHHLWTMNPDGTGQAIYFGNQKPGGVYLDAKPIPGTPRVVLSLSAGHGRTEHEGAIATVDDRHGPDYFPALRPITQRGLYRDPFPVGEHHFLAATSGTLVMADDRGSVVELYKLPPRADARAMKKTPVYLHEPRPIVPHARERVIPARVDLSQRTGRFLLADVTRGRNMVGVKPGEIKRLLVLESLPKPVNFTGGMDPLSYVGTFTLERVLGTVPVEPDGSAYFEAPALRSLLFVALDAQGRAVKRMQSFTSVEPGETLGCAGCHESRTLAGSPASARPALASLRAPSRIEPVADLPDVPDFTRDVQPILGRHCLKCHDVDKRAGGVLLAGDHGPMFSHAYYSLVVWRQVADGRNLAKSNYPPRALGSGGSALMKKLEPAHHGVQVSSRDRSMVALWLDIGAPYPGTYAALGTGMIGGYQKNEEDLENDKDWLESQTAAEAFRQRCASCHNTQKNPLPKYLSDENGLSFWQPSMDDPRLKRSRHIVFNLTRPEKSLMLLAPLAREAGGYGICQTTQTWERQSPDWRMSESSSTKASVVKHSASEKSDPLISTAFQRGGRGESLSEETVLTVSRGSGNTSQTRAQKLTPPAPHAVFTSTQDPDYQKLLAMVEAGRRRLDTIKRFDMPGFRPRLEYIRELKRYGVLPASFDLARDPIDVYAVDRKYWDLFTWTGKK